MVLAQLLGMVLLAMLHVGVTWAPSGRYPRQLMRLVHVDRERNLPAWFNSTQFLLLGTTLATIAVVEARRRPGSIRPRLWMLSAAGACFLSADEFAVIHERLGTYLGDLVEGAPPGSWLSRVGAFPSYYWTVIYVPVALPIAVGLMVFLWRQLGRLRIVALLGITSYLSGAVVLDAIEGYYNSGHHRRLLVTFGARRYRFDIFLVEELMEMAGLLLLIACFLRHLSKRLVESAPGDPPAPHHPSPAVAAEGPLGSD